MDKTRDVRRKASRFSPAKRHLSGHFFALGKSKRERLKKLSSVFEESFSFVEGVMRQFGGSERDGVQFVRASKKLKLPRKAQLLGDCSTVGKATVPRKLRSAMKKRNRESVSPTFTDSKRMSYSVRGGESPKKSGAKKFKKETNFGGSLGDDVSGPITKDEEEVAEALYALAGMFSDNASSDSTFRIDSSQDGTQKELNTGVPLMTTGASNSMVVNKENPSQQITEAFFSSEFKFNQPCDLLDSTKILKDSDSVAEDNPQHISLWPKNEESHGDLESAGSLGLTAEFGLDCGLRQPNEKGQSLSQTTRDNNNLLDLYKANKSDPQDMIKESKNDGEVRGRFVTKGANLSLRLSSTISNAISADSLLQSSAVKMPPWLDAAVCSMKPAAVDSSYLTRKVFKNSVDKCSWKRCAAHVQICRLILSSQARETDNRLLLQPMQIKVDQDIKQEHCIGFNGVLSSGGIKSEGTKYNEIGSFACHPKIQNQDKQALDFLSLSFGDGGANYNGGSRAGARNKLEVQSQLSFAPVNSLAQQHICFSQTHFSDAYGNQLPTISQQVQLTPFLRGSTQRSAIVSTKEQQQQQMLWAAAQVSTHYKPLAVASAKPRTVAQFPSWQGGRLESAVIPCTQTIVPPKPSMLEVLGPKQASSSNHNLRHLPSLSVALPHPGMKRQDHYPHSVYEETAARLYGGSALQLQLLCNERL